MKIHITNLYGMNSRGTQIISQRSVVKVAKELGFKEMSLYVYRVQSDTEGELRKRLDGITSSVEDGDIVIAQLPSWNLTRYDKALLDVIRMRRNVKIAVFIHDFVPMMFGGTELDYHQTIEVYNMADLLIVPSESLLDFLQEKGLKVEKVLFPAHVGCSLFGRTADTGISSADLFFRFTGEISVCIFMEL